VAEEKRPVGRPLKYASAEEMQVLIDRYFEACEAKSLMLVLAAAGADISKYIDREWITPDEFPTLSGLAVALDLTRKTLYNFSGREEFLPTVKKAKARVEAYAEQRLCRSNATGTIFSLKNNYGWADKTEIDSNFKGTLTTKTLQVVGVSPTD